MDSVGSGGRFGNGRKMHRAWKIQLCKIYDGEGMGGRAWRANV